MANQSDLGDDTYGLQDPDDLLQQQSAAYARAQQNTNASVRNISAGLQGISSFFGGGPEVNKARQTQAAFQNIMQQVNANSPDDEDPLTKSLRTAQAISTGMLAVNPQVALRAQDQAVRLAQAQKQQNFLSTQQQLESTRLSEEQYKFNIEKNTPHQVYLAYDQGKDENGIPLGYKEAGTYDATDPNAAAQMQADIKAGADNGQQLVPVTLDQLNNVKLQSAIAAADARIKASQQAAAAREAAAAQKGTNVINDRFTDRILEAADMGSTSLMNVASLPMGASRGFFGGALAGMGSKPSQSLIGMSKEALYNGIQPQDVQLYNVMTQPLFRTISTIESGGSLQGGSGGFLSSIKDTLSLKPTDTYMTMLSKLAEARQIYEQGTAIYTASKTIDPGKLAQIQSRLADMKKAVPWLPQDVVAFARAAESNPGLTMSQYAQQQGLVGAAEDPRRSIKQFSTPSMGTDSNGKPGKAVFGGGKQLDGATGKSIDADIPTAQGGSGQSVSGIIQRGSAASRGYGDPLGNQIYGSNP